MAYLYPNLPRYPRVDKIPLEQLYGDLLIYVGQLKFLLEQRDTEIDLRPSFRVYSVTTVTDIGNPSAGDVAFSLDESKFKGYTGSAWQDFN